MILKILSLGDRVKDGNYRLHSSFKKVMNFTGGKRLISLVLSETGPGPGNIVITALPEIKSLKIKKRTVYMDDSPQKVSGASVYDSAPGKFKIQDIQGNLSFCAGELSKLSPPLSMAFLFSPYGEKRFKNGFEKKMLVRMKQGTGFLKKGDFTLGTKTLSGLGFGLTPSGDDFLCGFALALKLFGGRDGREKVKVILKNFKSENLISLNSLKDYSEGRVDLKVKRFLVKLSSPAGRGLGGVVRDLVKRGHTSGADFLSGFLFFFGIYRGKV